MGVIVKVFQHALATLRSCEWENGIGLWFREVKGVPEVKDRRTALNHNSFVAEDFPLLLAAVDMKVPVSPAPALWMRQTKRPFVLRIAPFSTKLATTLSPLIEPETWMGVRSPAAKVRPFSEIFSPFAVNSFPV